MAKSISEDKETPMMEAKAHSKSFLQKAVRDKASKKILAVRSGSKKNAK